MGPINAKFKSEMTTSLIVGKAETELDICLFVCLFVCN